MIQEVKLPELGENIEKVVVVSVLVSVGDRIEKEQALLEVETEKASMEVPSPAEGSVKEIHVAEGDDVVVGQLLISLETAGSGSQGDAPASEPTVEDLEDVQAPAQQEEPEAVEDSAAKSAGSGSAEQIAPEAPEAPSVPRTSSPVPAAPSVRRLARELGLNIDDVQGSGPGGRISVDDVKRHSREILQGAAPATAPAGQRVNVPLPDLSAFGEVERQPITSIRRLTAESMARSWTLVPHVTQQDRADVTDLEMLRKRYARRIEAAGGKLTVTAIVLKVGAFALRKFPKFNATLDVVKQEVVFRRYVHIGVAVDTERGLLVPVVRDADRKNITEIAVELNDLAERARAKKLAPEEMRGAGFTVSNLGGLGTTYFSPIVNWPESAILGIGRAQTEAVWRDDGPVPRFILPLSISYDHRLIDGAEAARFLRWVAEALEHPLLLALEG